MGGNRGIITFSVQTENSLINLFPCKHLPFIAGKKFTDHILADTIEDIYGFEISHETISEITDSVLGQLEEWQNRPLKKFYTFLFVDCLYVTIRKDYETKNYAVYVILGYDVDGQKDILGLWLSESESKHQWMQIFDEVKTWC